MAATTKVNIQWRGDSKCVVKCEKYSSLGDTTTNIYDFSKHPRRKAPGPGMAQQITMDNRNKKIWQLNWLLDTGCFMTV